jgi:hypothetical protein
MEMILARAVAAFHPTDPQFNIVNFSPSAAAFQQRMRKRNSSESDGQLPSQSPSQSPSPVGSAVPSPVVGFRQPSAFNVHSGTLVSAAIGSSGLTPRSVGAGSGVTPLHGDSTTLGASANPYSTRTPSPGQKRSRAQSLGHGVSSDILGAIARIDHSSGQVQHNLFPAHDRLGDTSGAGPGSATEPGGSSNFFGPGQLLAPPATMYDAGPRITSQRHVGLGSDAVGLHGHSAGLANTVADVAGIAGVTSEIPGHSVGEFVSQDQALTMFRATLASAQQAIRDEVQELWNTIQNHEATIQSHVATIQSQQATIQNQQVQIDKIRATLSGIGGQH